MSAHPEYPYRHDEKNGWAFFQKHRLLLGVGLFGVLSLGIVLRSWPTFGYPGFYLEDAPYFFSFYYGGERAFSEVFRMPGTDYMTLVNEIVAWLTAFLDVRLQPYVYTFFSLFVGVMTCVLSLWLGLFRRVEFLVMAPVSLALVGIGRVSYYAVMVGSAWVMMILLFTLMLMKIPQSIPMAVLHALAMVFLCWAHPYSIVAVPLSIFILLMERDRKRSMVLGGVMLSSIAYFILATDKEVARLAGIGGLSSFWETLVRYYDVLIHGVVFMGFFEKVPVTLSFWVWVLLAGILLYLKDRGTLKTSGLLLFIIFSTSGIYYLSNRQILFKTGDPALLTRYILISFYFWILMLLYLAEKIMVKAEAGPMVRVAFSVCCLIWIAAYNLDKRHYFIFHREDPKSVAAFTNTVAYYETLAQKWKQQHIKIRLKPGRHMGAFLPEAVIGDASPASKNMGKTVKDLWDPETGFIIVPQ